jgi:hypothetical protein
MYPPCNLTGQGLRLLFPSVAFIVTIFSSEDQCLPPRNALHGVIDLLRDCWEIVKAITAPRGR